MLRVRPKQQGVLDYRRGRMGVSAVPGSGKTFTLALLAAQIVASGVLGDEQEVLVVTLVNSAVANFSGRVAGFVEEKGLLPHLGYRVRTLHGLAHDIVRERPGLVNLSDGFAIVDERDANRILQDAVDAWLRTHPGAADEFFSDQLDDRKRDWVRRDKWPGLIVQIAGSFVRQAKDLQLTPAQVRDRFERVMGERPLLLEMGCDVYADYQRALAYRGAVDFDDLIRLALHALESDSDYRQRLHERWPYVLEDEAQDSSRLQETILRLLTGLGGNWVRVGDANQAIYETFTTANPRYLRSFLREAGVVDRELPNSGRSTQSIIDLANSLIEWSRTPDAPEAMRAALSPPLIQPTPPGDPQPNPPDDPGAIHLVERKYSPRGEIEAVVESLAGWAPEHPESTVAVLVPRNQRGFELIDALKVRNIPFVELLRSTRETRETAGALGNVTNYLADPTSPSKLATVFRVWRRADREDEGAAAQVERVARTVGRCRQVEDFLWPRPGQDWLDGQKLLEDVPGVRGQLEEFRELVRRWQGATLLPIDQLILTLAQDLFVEPADLAVAHKLALLLRRASASHPDWQLPELTQELAVIARNQRRFLGLSDDDSGFEPDQHRGEVVVTTMHKAKGLEWDRVYLMSVNNYDFPSGLVHDTYIAEKWYVRDGLNLEAEALAQLKALVDENGIYGYVEGEATAQAREEYVAERLRLIYVGVTRARRELIVTWNTGQRGDCQPAVPFIAMQELWRRRNVPDERLDP